MLPCVQEMVLLLKAATLPPPASSKILINMSILSTLVIIYICPLSYSVEPQMMAKCNVIEISARINGNSARSTGLVLVLVVVMLVLVLVIVMLVLVFMNEDSLANYSRDHSYQNNSSLDADDSDDDDNDDDDDDNDDDDDENDDDDDDSNQSVQIWSTVGPSEEFYPTKTVYGREGQQIQLKCELLTRFIRWRHNGAFITNTQQYAAWRSG